MRDFIYDVQQAAIKDIRVPIRVTDFSWSILRYDLFRTCKRAYFLRYYLAQGGWDKYAHELVREAYFEKYMTTVNEWIRQTFQNSISEVIKKVYTANGRDRFQLFSKGILSSLESKLLELR